MTDAQKELLLSLVIAAGIGMVMAGLLLAFIGDGPHLPVLWLSIALAGYMLFITGVMRMWIHVENRDRKWREANHGPLPK